MTRNTFRAPLPPFVPGRARTRPVQPSANVAPAPWEASAAGRLAALRTAATMAVLELDAGMQDLRALEDETASDAEFPLEAFFVPEQCTRMPAGYDPAVHRAISQQVAARLDELAVTIRSSGMHAIGATPSADDLSRIVAAVVVGFYARQSD